MAEKRPKIVAKIIEFLCEFGELDPKNVNEDTRLVGEKAVVKSRTLVELLLAIEEYSEDELSVEFDWTSDSAMSADRSIFRTVGRLADHIFNLTETG